MIATWIAFLLYAAAAIGLGWRARGRQGEAETFWTAGRGLGALSVGLSISAGFLSVSWSCVYAVQLFYGYGLGAIWLITVPWLVALGGIYLLARRYHALPSFSQPEMVGQRFGDGCRRLVALALAFVFLVWGGAEIYVAAQLLGPALGISPTATILVISLVVGLYASLGGFQAVVDTDKLQYAVVVLYILAMAWLAARGLGEASLAGGSGWDALGASLGAGAEGADLVGARSGRPWWDPLSPGLATLLLTFAAYIPGWLFETDLWLRVQAARDTRAARRGVALAAVNGFLFVGVLPLFLGVSALVLFPLEADGSIPAAVGNQGDAIFAALVRSFAPPWLAVLVAVGLVAAAMSTIDTCVNVTALSVGERLEPRRFPLATAGSVAAATLFALATESLWDLFYLSSGVLTTSVAFPVAAIFLPRVRQRAIFVSSAAGLAGTVAAYFLESRGLLTALEPAWLVDTGVGFILWGLLAAVLGGLAGQVSGRLGRP